MPYSLKQAAQATGKTKPTILRAIQTSKISATRHEVTGAWLIEPAELHRVYPALAESVAQQDNSKKMTQDETGSEIALLRRELQLKDEQLGALREERQRERVQLEGAIDDLRHRLDTEGEERRRLTAILTDQNHQTQPKPRRWVLPAVIGVAVLALLILLVALGHPVRSSLP